MDELRRAEMTIEKMRQSMLPTAGDYPSTRGHGDGTACDGCSESVVSSEELVAVCVGGIMILLFHDMCYAAWRAFPNVPRAAANVIQRPTATASMRSTT
jgi:hypothetical protein